MIRAPFANVSITCVWLLAAACNSAKNHETVTPEISARPTNDTSPSPVQSNNAGPSTGAAASVETATANATNARSTTLDATSSDVLPVESTSSTNTPATRDSVKTSSTSTAGNVTTTTAGRSSATVSTVTPDADAGAQQSTNDESSSFHGTSSAPNETSDPCANPNLTWRTGHKTNYESYPDPGSEECIEYNGCYWAGMFAACNDRMPEEWVEAHDIVALFPHFDELALHDVCIRSGNTTMVVTVFDTCGDSDCDGCCTENRGSADALIDLEKYTNQRWGLPDGDVEWADLGPTRGEGCN